MSTFFPLPPSPNPLKFWCKALLLWAVILGTCYYLAGCSSPGKVGFAQLKRQNAAQTRVLKAVAVHADGIAKHADRGLKLVDDLAHTQLDPAQAKQVDEIRLELNAVKLENTGLVQQLLNAQALAIQQTATIVQTQTEVKAAAHEGFWRRMKLRVVWLLIGFAAGSLLAWFFRAAIRGALLAGAPYCPPLGRLVR